MTTEEEKMAFRSKFSVIRNEIQRIQHLKNMIRSQSLASEIQSANSNFEEMQAQQPKVVDFRSDTFSLPTKEMRSIMFNAEVGNSGYHEDPTKIALEKKAAALFEKENAVLVTSGTMANLVSVLVYCRQRPSEILLGNKSHMNLFEQAGAAQFGAVNMRELENKPDGTFDLTELRAKIRTSGIYEPRTRLVCVENTHNMCGGRILPLEWLDEVVGLAKSRNIPLHLDGSRIFNASVKSKIPVSRLSRGFDSVNVCLSKGLGCPYGSILLGSKDFISEATKVIKALGGGTRQIGYMAAAGIFSLDKMVERLQEDHEHIEMIANTIRQMDHPYIKVPPADEVHTNILNVDFDSDHITPKDFLAHLGTVSKNGPNVVIKAIAFTSGSIRFVACSNVSKSDMPDVIGKIRHVVDEFR